MLNDRQSLILCGLMVAGIFVFGILDLLDNYITKTVLTIIFLLIMSNFYVVFSKAKKERQKDSNQ